jgi:hypothetical protein
MITDRPFYVIFMAPWTKYRWFTWTAPYPTEAEAINAIQQRRSIDKSAVRTVTRKVGDNTYVTTNGQVSFNATSPNP